MTRISATITPAELCDQMLMAEHREIVRIPNMIKSGKAKVENIPASFRLGTGHVKFFYDKVAYLHARYHALHNECINRGFNVSDFHEAFNDIPIELYNNWIPEPYVRDLLVDRINERLSSMKVIRYKSNEIKLETAAL
jgi:deoxyribonuclease (pyrimidine dimer)